MINNKVAKALCDYITSEYGIKVSGIVLVKKGLTNTNYIVYSGEYKYIFKIYNFKNMEHVEFEVDVLEKLRKHNFVSPRIVKRLNGDMLGEYNSKPSLMYEYVEGDTKQVWSTEHIESVGEHMGDIHVLLKDFNNRSKSRIFDHDSIKKLVKLQGHKLSDAHFPDAERLIDFMEENLDKMSFPDDLPCGITHHDIKPENVLFMGGKLVGIIDFDLTHYGVLINDIATTIIWSCFKDRELQLLKLQAFINGYESKRKLTKLEREHLIGAIHYRLVREAFSSPFDVLPHHMKITKKRSDEFMEAAKHFEKIKNTAIALFRE